MTVIGIDLGIRKAAVVAHHEDSIHTFVYEADSTLTRDMQLAQVASFAYNVSLTFTSDSIWIEDSLIGNNRKYSLMITETKGAVLAALAQLRMLSRTQIHLVNVGSWKKEIVGKGNASKDDVRNYIIDTHPAYAPLCGEDQDLYDACCVGLYGLRIVSRSKELNLQS